MFAQILGTQWAWTRTTVLILAVLTFAFPALLWRFATLAFGEAIGAAGLMASFSTLGGFLAVVAILAAVLTAAQPWSVEHETRHVYALSLPIPWSRYLAMRYGAGALILGLLAVTLWLGALLALAMVDVPAQLQSYPGRLALRFLLAMLLTYSATFALQYIAGKRAPAVVLALLVSALLGFLLMEVLGFGAVSQRLFDGLVNWPGPLAVFFDSWRLIDV